MHILCKADFKEGLYFRSFLVGSQGFNEGEGQDWAEGGGEKEGGMGKGT